LNEKLAIRAIFVGHLASYHRGTREHIPKLEQRERERSPCVKYVEDHARDWLTAVLDYDSFLEKGIYF
jgi:hypothetical protein